MTRADMLLRRIGAIITALLLVTCSGTPARVTVSPAFHPDERAALRDVAQQWNDLVDDPLSLDGGPWRLERAQPPAGYAGWTDAHTRTVLLAPDLEPRAFRVAARHELGHVLRLRHVVDERSVMHPGAPVDSFSHCDVVECIRVGACERRLDFATDECPTAP